MCMVVCRMNAQRLKEEVSDKWITSDVMWSLVLAHWTMWLIGELCWSLQMRKTTVSAQRWWMVDRTSLWEKVSLVWFTQTMRSSHLLFSCLLLCNDVTRRAGADADEVDIDWHPVFAFHVLYCFFVGFFCVCVCVSRHAFLLSSFKEGEEGEKKEQT